MLESTKEMQDWFGQGEVDVSLMLLYGRVTHEVIIKLWETDSSSPGYKVEE